MKESSPYWTWKKACFVFFDFEAEKTGSEYLLQLDPLLILLPSNHFGELPFENFALIMNFLFISLNLSLQSSYRKVRHFISARFPFFSPSDFQIFFLLYVSKWDNERLNILYHLSLIVESFFFLLLNSHCTNFSLLQLS